MKDIITCIVFPYGLIAATDLFLLIALIVSLFLNKRKKSFSVHKWIVGIIACSVVFISSLGYCGYLAQDLALKDHVVIEEIRYSDNYTPRRSPRRRRTMRPPMTNFTFTTKTDSVTLRAANTVLPQMKIGSMYKIRYAKRTKVLLQATEIPEEEIDINEYINNNRLK